MEIAQVVRRYRGYAGDCLRIAQDTSDSGSKLSLLDMAQVWLKRADQTEKQAQHR